MIVEAKPLYRQIANILRQEIRTNRSVGDRLDAESQIARRFHVTVMTVREALRTLQQEGWLERRHNKGNFVVNVTDPRSVAILCQTDITHPSAKYYHRHVVHILRKELSRLGYSTRLFIGRQSPLISAPDPIPYDIIQELNRGALSGIVAVNTNPDKSWMDLAAAQQLPVIGNPALYEYGEVGDWSLMVETGVMHLVKQGCRRIAFMEWRNPIDDEISRSCRRETFLSAISKFGLESNEGWICGDLNPHMPGAGWSGFREIWTHSKNRPDGIFFTDDVLFQDTVTAILELGVKVPEQLAIVTLANRGLDFACPFPVTRLEFDPECIAVGLAKMMGALIKGEKLTINKRYHPFSVVETPGREVGMEELEASEQITRRNEGSDR